MFFYCLQCLLSTQQKNFLTTQERKHKRERIHPFILDLFNYMSVFQSYISVEWYTDSEQCGRTCSWLNLRHCPGTCLKGWGKPRSQSEQQIFRPAIWIWDLLNMKHEWMLTTCAQHFVEGKEEGEIEITSSDIWLFLTQSTILFLSRVTSNCPNQKKKKEDLEGLEDVLMINHKLI